jgi:hypothetical protein
VATSHPSSSCSISTVNFLGVFTRSLGPQSITGRERGLIVVLAVCGGRGWRGAGNRCSGLRYGTWGARLVALAQTVRWRAA